MNKLKKVFTYITLITMVASVFLGCEQPNTPPKPKEGKCILSASSEKYLVSDVASDVAEYQYKATPQFSGSTSGSAAEWSHLSYGGPGTIGLLTQGRWVFELRGLNSSGKVITTGRTEKNIEAGKDNIVEVQMKTDESIGNGTISYSVWTQNVSETATVMKVYERITGTTDWKSVAEYKSLENENPRYNGTITNMKSGHHDIMFMLFNAKGAVIGGEQIGVQVVAGSNTSISGIVEPSTEVEMNVTIKSMGYVHALLDSKGDVQIEGEGRDRVAMIERDDTVKFSWVDQPDATSIPTEWIWALDGEIVQNPGKDYTVCFDKYGEHELSVVGIRRDKDGKAWDAGSAVIRIVVVRHICEITFLGNGGFFADGTDVCIIAEDTTLAETRQVPGGQPYDGISPQRTGYMLTGWKDESTGKVVVTVAKDGTVTFLDDFITKKETRTLSAVWVPGEYTLTVIWGENVKAHGQKVPYSKTYDIASGDFLNMLDDKPERPGFVFLNYTTEENGRGEKMTSKDKYIWGRDKTLYANWEYIPITVGFHKVYSNYENRKAPYKSTIVGSDLRYGSLPQPLRQGKVFKGWAHPEDTDPTQYEIVDGIKYLSDNALKEGKEFVVVDSMVRKYYDHVLVAVWGEGQIKISFNYANANLTKEGRDSIEAFEKDDLGVYFKKGALGTMYGALPFTGIETRVRDGWEFMGWYDSPSYSMRVYEVSAVTNMSDHMLYGKWEGKRLKVSFETGITEKFPDKEVRYEGLYGELPIPSRMGYEFKGWYLEDQLISEDTRVKLQDNHTLTARWEPAKMALQIVPNNGKWDNPTELIIRFDDPYKSAKSLDGKFILGDNKADDGLNRPTRFGYDFSGWYYTSTGTGDRITGEYLNKNTEAHSLYALWNAHKHKLHFYYQWPYATSNPAESLSEDIAFGASYGTLPLPKITGYTFNGWYTDPKAGSQVSAATRLTVDENVNLYAHWSVIKINVSFSDEGENCVDKGGKTLQPILCTWGQKYGQLPTPYKKGYRFTGEWEIVGQEDEFGRPIRVKNETIVAFEQDIVLNPIWEPLDILVIMPKDGTVTKDGQVLNVDWTNVIYRAVTFSKAFNTAKAVSITGNGTWKTTNEAFSSTNPVYPTHTKKGYYYNSYSIVAPGLSVTEGNPTSFLWDYNVSDEVMKEKFSALSPDQMVWFIPNWQPEKYTINFVSKIDRDGEILDTDKAPYISERVASYLQTLGTVMGSENPNDWAPYWKGYYCDGFYLDPGLENKINSNDKFGEEPLVNESKKITIYVRWKKTYTQYWFSTKDSMLYPEGSNQRLFNSRDMFEGVNQGYLNGPKGWYDFVGKVNGINYTKGKVRIGYDNKQDVELTRFEAVGYGAKETFTWTAPADMKIRVDYLTPSYDYTFVCSECGGKGYKGTSYQHERTKTEKTIDPTKGKYEVPCPSEYIDSYKKGKYRKKDENDVYQSCVYQSEGYYGESYTPCTTHEYNRAGCNDWPNKILYELPCIGCKGNNHEVKYRWYEESHTYDVESEIPETDIQGKPKYDENGDPIMKEHHSQQTDYYLYYEKYTCYCNKFGGGKVVLSQGSNLGKEYGELDIFVNSIKVAENSGEARKSYIRCKNPSFSSGEWKWGDSAFYDATCHYDNAVQNSFWIWITGAYKCHNCEGVRATTRTGNSMHRQSIYNPVDATLSTYNGFWVKRGDVVTIEFYLPDNEDQYIKLNKHPGHVILYDDGKEYTNPAVGEDDGYVRDLGYDYYEPVNGAYFTAGGTAKTTEPYFKYYSYAGAMRKNVWALEGIPDMNNAEPVSKELIDLGRIEAKDLDSSKPSTISYKDKDNNVVTGAFGAAGTFLTWSEGELNATFTTSGGTIKTLNYQKRTVGFPGKDPMKDIEISLWLKEE